MPEIDIAICSALQCLNKNSCQYIIIGVLGVNLVTFVYNMTNGHRQSHFFHGYDPKYDPKRSTKWLS